jgi:methionyl-tRNA synthetase
MSRRLLVTSALPYANGHIHIGHLVEYLQTDMWVRFQRLRGNQATYLCADDTHGTAIMIAARKAGQPESALLAEMSAAHQRDFADFGIRFDHYGSTDAPENRELVYDIWRKLRAGGHVDEKVVEQLYDPQAGAFLADRFVKGTCPKCGAPDQYGDSCDKCGATYEATELKNPKSTLSGATPELKSATHCFVKLEDFRAAIAAWVERPGSLHPDMANWVRNTFLIEGEPLRAWDVSRPAAYFGFEIPDLPGNYFYVWLDAPFGYIATTVAWCAAVGAEKSGGDWRSWWQGGNAEIHHFIGKDIAKFHTLFWPAMLGLGGYDLPAAVHIHGFLTVNGEKMSKSKGTFIKARTYLEHLDPTYLRYYYAAKLSAKAEDLDLNVDEFIAKVNSDLVGKLVNLASRTAKFVPALTAAYPADGGLFARAAAESDGIAAAYEAGDFGEAMRRIMALADRANEYVEQAAPWALKKDPARSSELAEVCTVALNLFRQLCVYLAPVLPSFAQQAGDLLAAPITTWGDAQVPITGRAIGAFQHMLQRVDPAKVAAMVAASKVVEPGSEAVPAAATEPTVDDGAALHDEPLAGICTFDDFMKVDLRVARVLTAEEIPKAKKILKLTVTLGGDERRTIFAGIKSAYQPAQLVGRLVVIVANLAPRQMSFGLSEGMVIAAGPGEQEIFVLSPDSGAKPGQRIH